MSRKIIDLVRLRQEADPALELLARAVRDRGGTVQETKSPNMACRLPNGTTLTIRARERTVEELICWYKKSGTPIPECLKIYDEQA